MRKVRLAIAIVLSVAATWLMHVGSTEQWEKASLLKEKGVATQAEITKVKAEYKNGSVNPDKNHEVTYSFTAENGKTVSDTIWMSGQTVKDYVGLEDGHYGVKSGLTLDVIYLPDDPKIHDTKSRVEGAEKPILWHNAMIAVVGGVVFYFLLGFLPFL